MTTPQSRYEFIETLGPGATRRVDKARDTLIGRTVALKTFLHGFGSGDVQKQFLREAQIIGRLAHPFIVGLYDVGTDSNNVPFFVMEFVEGKTLERVLDAGPLPLEKAAVWAADLCAAISRAHRAKVIHGDIKPANILVTKDGQVKLGDFGIARFATQVSTTGTVMGTPAYLSPEQIQGQTQDNRSDLFSLGIILYQMTTGVRPFNGSSVGAVCAQIVSITPPPPSHHNPSLPPAFDRIVMRCLAKDPAERYATAEALGASLYPFAHGKDTAAEAASTSSQWMQGVQLRATTTLKMLTAKIDEISKNLPATVEGILTSKSMWWNRPMERKDMYVMSGAALALVALVPIAHALLYSSHQQPGASMASLSAPAGATGSTAPSTATAATSARASGAPVAGMTPGDAPITSNASMINISSSNPAEPTLVTTDGDTSVPDRASVDAQDDVTRPPVVVTRAFERRPIRPLVTASGSQPSKNSVKTASASKFAGLPAYGPSLPAPEPAPKAPAAPVIPQTNLRIDIVSGVTDQTLAIYSGTELLLTTPLQPEHLGDTLRFNCPIPAGEHALRVVLYRADKTVLLKKENNSELHPDGTNTMEVRINRRAKMLLKHETQLEVVWPSSTASSAVIAAPDFKPAGALALR
jgi:serine/threonine protein kinase